MNSYPTLFTLFFSSALLASSACTSSPGRQSVTPSTDTTLLAEEPAPMPQFCAAGRQPTVSYTPQDSTQVVTLLREGAKQPSGTPLTLYYAHRLMDIPYVSATPEVHPEERLTVNLTQLDCLTLTENVLALSLATRRGDGSFESFCHWLRTIRYRQGKLDGYASRNHYFTQWVNSNAQMGIVKELQGEGTANHYPFLRSRKTDLHFMTANPTKYPLLKDEKQKGKDREPGSHTSLIRQYEEEANGTHIRYIPKSLLNQRKEKLGCIQDGDILALVTNKDGLDVTHLGLAVWGEDGLLHLLNASSLYHKVILDPVPLYQYLNKRNHLLGIRVVAPCVNEQ